MCIQKETGAKEIKERADFDILMYGKPYIVLWEIWPTQVYANQQVEYIAEAFCNFFIALCIPPVQSIGEEEGFDEITEILILFNWPEIGWPPLTVVGGL